MYRTVVIEYSPQAEAMAEKIEAAANAMSEKGFRLVTMSVTGAARAILVFEESV